MISFQKEKDNTVKEISERCNDEKGEGEEAASFGVQYG
jgi:hypothetical protein